MDDDFANKPTADEARALDRLYDGNKVALPAPAEKGVLRSYSPAIATIDRRAPEVFAATGVDPAAQLRFTFNRIAIETQIPDGVLAQIAEGHLSRNDTGK